MLPRSLSLSLLLLPVVPCSLAGCAEAPEDVASVSGAQRALESGAIDPRGELFPRVEGLALIGKETAITIGDVNKRKAVLGALGGPIRRAAGSPRCEADWTLLLFGHGGVELGEIGYHPCTATFVLRVAGAEYTLDAATPSVIEETFAAPRVVMDYVWGVDGLKSGGSTNPDDVPIVLRALYLNAVPSAAAPAVGRHLTTHLLRRGREEAVTVMVHDLPEDAAPQPFPAALSVDGHIVGWVRFRPTNFEREAL